MGQRSVVARLWMPTLAALLLATTPAVRPGSSDLAQTRSGDRTEAFGAIPPGEPLALGTSRLSVSEFSRGIERFRPLAVAAGLVALCGLFAVAVCWRSSLRQRRSRTVLSALRRLAGPRAPPLQVA
jgi:hypothetical protein